MSARRIILTGDAKAEFDRTVRREYPGMDIQRARVYEWEPDAFEVVLQVSGPDRLRGREVLKPNDQERTQFYNALLPAIRKAKQHAADMRKQAHAESLPDVEDYMSDALWVFDLKREA